MKYKILAVIRTGLLPLPTGEGLRSAFIQWVERSRNPSTRRSRHFIFTPVPSVWEYPTVAFLFEALILQVARGEAPRHLQKRRC